MQDQFSPASPSWRVSSPVQSFRFRIRTESIDWRRLAALDLDHMVRETDINLLQEFVAAVTFCNAEAERCPRCRCPIDLTLLKALRVSQLCTEYLLHCQEYLREQVLKLEDSLQGALSRTHRQEEERARLQKELNEVRLESRRRKKLISVQQQLLQASAHNHHKCQYCEKCFVNYSYLQSHLQRRHHEISDAEEQKRKQVEQMKDTIEDLKEKLKVTQNLLEAERETETQRSQQELEERRRREVAEKEAMEKWEEERRTFQEQISELKQSFLQEFKHVANKSSFLEAKLHELESRELRVSNLKGEDDHEKMQMRIRERELQEQMTHKRNVWKKKLKETQNKLEHEKEQLQEENERLLKALSMEESSSSSLRSLKQQVHSLSSQLRQKDTLIHSQKKKIKKLAVRSLSEPPAYTSAQNFANEEDEDEEEEHVSPPIDLEAQWKFLESVRGNPKMMKDYRPIVDEKLQQKLEELGLRMGTKGISSQTLRSLSSQLSILRVQKFRNQADIRDLRENIETELNKRVKELQRKRGRAAPNTHTQKRKKLQSPTVVLSPKRKQVRSKPSPKKPETLPPKAAPRSKAPPQTTKSQQKKNRTPPFSSEEEEEEEEEEGKDSAYITSPQHKPTTSLHLTPSEEQQRAESDFDWSDSDASNAANTERMQQAHSTQGSVVQTLTRSLEKQLSSSITKPAGGIRVLPPASERTPRPSIVKQQAVSEEESDMDLSSIEELFAHPTASGRVTSDMLGTSGTSVWSSGASRPGAW